MEYRTVKSGTWNDPSIWEPRGIPDLNTDDRVVIRHGVTLDDGPPNHFELNALVLNPGPGEPRLRPVQGIKYQIVVPRDMQ
jgi:hypothetical protein